MNANLLKLEKSPVDERDWKTRKLLTQGQELPSVLDLRPKLPPIRNQGVQGSCVAMSAACMKEWQEQLDIQHEGYFSPQFIYNLRENTSVEGMYPRDLMRILNKFGDCPEEDYPYGSTEAANEDVLAKASNFKIKGYAKIEDIDNMKLALNTNGVCLVAVPVYNNGPRMWLKEYGELMLGGHAMAVVGYNYEGFILRNSWGPEWGDKGYTILPYEDWRWIWEAWTTIDENSIKPVKKRSWFDKIVELLTYLLTDWPSLKGW